MFGPGVPELGGLDPSGLSLPLLTVIIAGLDGFNPCAFFVLLFLLSFLVHARSRRRMLVVGGLFVLVSGLVYFLFMSAWLNVFLLAGRLPAITAAAGIVALALASVNIKDFFFFRKGPSLSIPDSAKPGIFRRARMLAASSSTAAFLGGTVALALVANMYEFLCTAGLPMVFTRVLTLRKLDTAEYYLYLAFYNAVYVVPLAVIVVLFSVTLGARKLSEWQGRVLKLVSGLMMLAMGGLLLINPALLNNPVTAVLLLAAVLVVSGVVAAAARRMGLGGRGAAGLY